MYRGRALQFRMGDKNAQLLYPASPPPLCVCVFKAPRTLDAYKYDDNNDFSTTRTMRTALAATRRLP